MTSQQGAPALDDVKTEREADAADSPKPHGDKLAVAGGAAAEAASTASGEALAGDSPKPHGEKLARAVDEAAKG